jgi:leader peptidase (prepilin peptidase) / N-methyltransferase
MLNFLVNVPVIIWTLWAFLLGSAVGSMLNVCIARLPQEKSILWPSSRCGTCYQPIRWYDNIPLLSYWRLRGRCRMCGAKFSIRYFLIELLTGVLFAGMFLVEIVWNIHDLPFFNQQAWNIRNGTPPWWAWAFFGHHAVLLSLLIVAAACDLERREIPMSLTFFGTAVGLIGATLFPWPWPGDVNQPGFVPQPPPAQWWANLQTVGSGLYPWPLWGPLPDWMPLGSRRAGFATGVAGALVGTWMLRGIRWLFSKGLGREALGLGDADLMMMAGSCLGWQPVVVAFFAGAMVTLGFAIVQAVVFRDNSLPFGPGLAVGVVVTWLCWRWIGPAVQPLMFNEFLLLLVVGAGGGFMLLMSAFFRFIRGPQVPEAA